VLVETVVLLHSKGDPAGSKLYSHHEVVFGSL